MSYVATIPVSFECSRHTVYEALCDLGRYPEWNSGMTSISHAGRMHEGLNYETVTNVLGRANTATVQVEKMVPDSLLVLVSKAGLVAFRAIYELEEISPERCTVVCNLHLTFNSALFNLAHPVVEAVAESRVRADLESLRASLL